jgi:hypothetical protein
VAVDAGVRDEIERRDPVQQLPQHPPESETSRQASRETGDRQEQPAPKDQHDHVAGSRAKRNPHADLTSAPDVPPDFGLTFDPNLNGSPAQLSTQARVVEPAPSSSSIADECRSSPAPFV